MDIVEIIVPDVSDDYVSTQLRALTAALNGRGHEKARGFLGGEDGYGVPFENDVFMMHPYCWCEKRDCLWCMIWLSNAEYCTEEQAKAHRDKDIEQIRALYGQAAADRHLGAPHFWHKASGAQVWWYKYIGRGMDIEPPAAGLSWEAVMFDCFSSLNRAA